MGPSGGGKEKYERNKKRYDAAHKLPFAKRWFGWWNNPSDRFSFLVAFFTCGVFAATVALWLATKDLVNDAEDTAERQLRAYIVVSGVNMPITPDGFYKPSAQIKNVGLTPAYDFRAWFAMQAMRPDQRDFARPNDAAVKSTGILGPGQQTILGGFFPLAPANVVQQEIRAGNRTFFIWGG